MAEVKKGQVSLKNVRPSFFKAFEKTASTEGGDEKYRTNFLIDPTTPDGKKNIKAINAAIADVKKEAWKEKADKIVIKQDRMAFRKGETFASQSTGEVYDGYDDMEVVVASNSMRPTIVDRDRTPLVKENGRPYSGCFVNAVVRFYTITDPKKGGNGVFCTLEAVQFVKDGESFGATAVAAEDVFEDLGDDEDADDGLDDDDDMI